MDSTGSQSAGKLVPWLAGMIDADGSIGLHRQPYKGKAHYVPSITLVTSCGKTRAFLEQLYDNIQVGKHITERVPKNKNWNKVWVFDTRGMKRVERLLEILRPHLITKAGEADLVSEFICYRKSVPLMTPYGDVEERCKKKLAEIKSNRN